MVAITDKNAGLDPRCGKRSRPGAPRPTDVSCTGSVPPVSIAGPAAGRRPAASPSSTGQGRGRRVQGLQTLPARPGNPQHRSGPQGLQIHPRAIGRITFRAHPGGTGLGGWQQSYTLAAGGQRDRRGHAATVRVNLASRLVQDDGQKRARHLNSAL